MRLVETASRDFSDDELFATKETLGQIYLDVSTKLAPDDFARDLRKLVRASECVSCEKREACPTAFSPLATDVFTRDDERVRAHLTTLRGRVLDVGAGEGVYLDTLATAASEGAIDLVCVDPDSARLAMIASRYPFARCVVCRAEDLGEDLGVFDHVLVLRSYNHLLDPSAVIAAALARLTEGGTLTLADNVAFGLVRSASHAARAEAAPENELEHYRNEGAAEAMARVSRLLAAPRSDGRTLRLIERRDVGPETSNQWLLRYECALARRHLE